MIAARSGAAPVSAALASLSAASDRCLLEIVVANSSGEPAARQIARSHPEVLVVPVPPEASIAESRIAAIQKTTGEVVVVLHERYEVGRDWADHVIRAHRSQAADVITGCIAPKRELSAAQWAMYLSEYSHAGCPAISGALDRAQATMAPGGNTSYKRSALRELSGKPYLWELDFHSDLFDRGATFYRDGGMVAEWAHPYTVREYLAERLAVSRGFAARRAALMTPGARVGSAALRCALPVLLLMRVARTAFRKSQGSRFLIALPWLIAFSLVQTWGEITGYLGRRSRAPQF